MHIALIADPYIPVPPKAYGGIERIVDMLIKGYLERGHKVTLWAHPDSEVNCELIPYGIPPHQGFIIRIKELWQVSGGLYKRRKDFDIIHSFGRLAGMSLLYFLKIPKIQSYQRSVTKRNVWLADKLVAGTIFFTANSNSCGRYGSLPGRWQTIYNGVPLDKYEFNGDISSNAPLVFLGRIEEIKGAHTAIDVALATGKKLIIAGNIVEKGDAYNYFKEKIEPRVDGEQIRYIGEVNDGQKNDLLGRALALLMPVECEESFGIVMAEALACGTPVIGFRKGSIPEVVEDGINGFICDTKEEMIEAVEKVSGIERDKCRKIAQEKFSEDVIVEEYLRLYGD